MGIVARIMRRVATAARERLQSACAGGRSLWIAGLCATLMCPTSALPVEHGSADAAADRPPQLASPGPGAAGWRFVGVRKQPPTRFVRTKVDGASALRVEAAASYGNLVHDFEPPAQAGKLAWQWRLDEPNAAADLSRRATDDTNLKVCALFDLPIEQVPLRERHLLLIARSLSAEPLPAATVCYVWDTRLPAGTVVPNAYSARVRYFVLQGTDAPSRQWVGERRDLAADFLQAFGEESATVPALLAIAVGADADNTRGRSLAYLRGLRWAGR